MATISLPTRSGMTRTNLDLMSTSVSELTVPFVSPHVYYNLLTGDGTIGDFSISCYSPLTDVSDTGQVTIQVQARFVDVDLEFPTGTTAPSLSVFSPIVESLEKLKFTPSILNLKEVKRMVNQLIKRNESGEISLQMNDKIDTLNVKPKALPNMAVTNSNNSHVMSLFSSNVLPSSNLGGNVGEMEILSMVQIPCYHDNFSVSNEAADTNVWSKQVHPLIPASTNSDGSLNVDYIYFNALPFSKWSSSFIYTFKVVKTRFHSLRLRVWFSPASTDPSTIDRNATRSKIIDLKEQNEFQFEVPYIWPHPKLNVHSLPQSLGIIGVDIVNPMVYPTSVASSIDVIVERAAGPDFKVNLVAPLQAFPFIPSATKTRNAQDIRDNLPDKTFEYEPLVGDLIDIIPFNSQDPRELLTNTILSNRIMQDPGKISDLVKSYDDKHVNALNWLNSFDTLNASSLFLPIGLILNKIKEGKIRVLTKRSADSFVKDLTTEGIEPNPGPTETLTNFISSTATVRSFTSTLSGPMRIQISLVQYLDTSDIVLITFSGAYTSGSYPVIKSAPSYIVFDYLGDTPTITATNGNVADGFAWITITFSNDFVPTPISSSPPLDVVITNTPLPVTDAGGGPDAIVTTTSIDLQMNTSEQDSERKISNNFVRPVQSQMADNVCLGTQINSIKDMICRASLVYRNTTVPSSSLLNIYPHMFGLTQGSFASSNAQDILSYYASVYAFARGGINLRFVSAPDFGYILSLSGDNFFSTASASTGIVHQNVDAISDAYSRALGGSLQQVIKPNIEGYGEITIPFYSDTYMYYVSPSVTMDTTAAMSELRLPYTTCLLQLLGDLTNLAIYRAASSDFELSFLTGPPVLFLNV